MVLLIDEIDKADTDFQDDMLDVLDQMEFDIIEIDKTIRAKHRPVIIITSNAKKDLSDPFLGRCNFHHIAFPEPEMMRKIVQVHFHGYRQGVARQRDQDILSPQGDQGDREEACHPGADQLDRALRADPDFQGQGSDQRRGSLPGRALQEEPRLFDGPECGIPLQSVKWKLKDSRAQRVQGHCLPAGRVSLYSSYSSQP